MHELLAHIFWYPYEQPYAAAMLDLFSDRILESEDYFRGRNGHRFVEFLDQGNGEPPTNSSGELKEADIAYWAEENFVGRAYRSGLKVLLSPKPSGNPSSGKLPFSRETYQSLAQAWRIPPIFIRAMAQKLAIVTECSVAPDPSSPNYSQEADVQHAEQRLAGRNIISSSARCLLVRGDVDWTWDYTLLLTHDPETHTTYALIVGLTAVEIDFVQNYLTTLASSTSFSAKSTVPLMTHPILLPTILLDLATDDTSFLLKLRTKLLGQIQQSTGMDRFNFLRSTASEGKRSSGVAQERHELDLDDIMLRLTCLSDWVAAQRGFVGLQKKIVEVVSSMLSGSDDRHDVIDDRAVKQVFSERLNFVKESLIAAEQKCMYLERSIGAQVQTIYSLIGQKDNRLNIAAASASCQIASDSRRIAILTRRDSTDMRIIAAVTLIFLPGTFVATVFSTGFFDWGNGDSSPNSLGDEGGARKTVSSYIWVYFMMTGVLTFLVLVAWIMFSWFQNRKMMKRFGGLDIELAYDGGLDSGGKRRDTETTLGTAVEGRPPERVERVWRELERWKEEARGSMRWPGKLRKGSRQGAVAEELKRA